LEVQDRAVAAVVEAVEPATAAVVVPYHVKTVEMVE